MISTRGAMSPGFSGPFLRGRAPSRVGDETGTRSGDDA
jgi:hypothetical protein